MLNITVQSNSQGAKAYFAKSDYLSQGDELVGRWGGKGAVLLGLFGQVEQADFDALCDNRYPQTGKPLTRITRADRRVGYDFTWSAPKSISVIHALTGDERIVEAFRQSIDDTMSEMEADLQARVRKGKSDSERTTGNMCWAEFVHKTSRPVDGVPCPQLHVHAFCLNVTFDAVEGQWKAGQFGAIKDSAYYWQAVQQARFARGLQDLGYSIRQTKHAFEIEGVPDAMLKRFSLRTNVIERVAEQLGITDPKRKAKLAATTREAKNHSVSYDKLIELWKQWVSPSEQAGLLVARSNQGAPLVDNAAHARFAVEHEFARKSVMEERRLLTTALRHGCGEVTPEGMRREFATLGLLSRADENTMLVSTPEVLAREQRMLGFAVGGKGACRPLAAGQAIEWRDKRLSAEQRQAVSHILTSPDKVVLLRGIAGTGKTTLTHEAVGQLEARGRNVVMLAPTSNASRGVLRDEGFPEAETLKSFLGRDDLQASAKGGVIWVDEAGLVGTNSMALLFEAANRLDARVVLAGDKRQLASIEAGTPLRVLEETGKLKAAEVKEIRRQSGEYREVVKLLSQGKAGAALAKLGALGWVKVLPADERYKAVAAEYADAIAAVPEKDRLHEAMIVCPTHREADRIDEELRETLKDKGLIDREERVFKRLIPLQWTEAERADRKGYGGGEVLQFHRNSGDFKAGLRIAAADALPRLTPASAGAFAVFVGDEIAISRGDVIRITANGKTADGAHRLNNGSVYLVSGFTRSGDIVLGNSWIVSKHFGHLAHGYVNTAFAAQGRTVNKVLVCQSSMSMPASSREGFYVAISRGRKAATVFTDNGELLREAVQRSDVRMSATELVAKPKKQWLVKMREVMAQAQQRALKLALDVAQQAHAVPKQEFAYER